MPVEVWTTDQHRLGLKPVNRRVWAPVGQQGGDVEPLIAMVAEPDRRYVDPLPKYQPPASKVFVPAFVAWPAAQSLATLALASRRLLN
jgi:hypothetical protein